MVNVKDVYKALKMGLITKDQAADVLKLLNKNDPRANELLEKYISLNVTRPGRVEPLPVSKLPPAARIYLFKPGMLIEPDRRFIIPGERIALITRKRPVKVKKTEHPVNQKVQTQPKPDIQMPKPKESKPLFMYIILAVIIIAVIILLIKKR